MGRGRETDVHAQASRGISVCVALCAIVILFILLPSSVLADPAQPDSLTIRDVKVFHNLIETGDFLAVVAFDIDYTVPPDEPARTYFLFRFIDDGGEDIGQQLPASFGENGYYYGITAFYFTSSPCPSWQGLHQIQLEGNPTQWDTLPSESTWNLSAGDYSTSSSSTANRDELESWLILAMQDIETNWNVPGELLQSTTNGIQLTVNGQVYINQAISGCAFLAPGIFTISSTPASYPDDTDWGNRGDDLETGYSGSRLDDFKEAIGSLFGGIDYRIVFGVIILILAGVLMGVSFARWGETEASYSIIPILLLYSAKLTLFPWELYGLCAFAAAIYIVYSKVIKTA